MQINMNLKEVEDYLGITDNDNYMYKAEVIMQFRMLEKLIANMNYEKLEVILEEDYYHLGLDNKIVYKFKGLIVYEENNNIRS